MKQICVIVVCCLLVSFVKGQEAKLMLPIGHTWFVGSAVFNSNSKWIFSSSADGSVKIWETASGKQIAEFFHGPNIGAIAVSSSGKRVISADEDGMIKVWDINTNKLLYYKNKHTKRIYEIKISADNILFATASEDGTAKVWNLEDGKLIADLIVRTAGVWTIDFSPNGKNIVTGTGDNQCIVWDIASASIVYQKKTKGTYVTKYSNNGDRIISSSYNKIIVWDAKSGDSLLSFGGHSDWITTASFSNAEEKIVTASMDGTVKIYNAVNGAVLNEFKAIKNAFNVATISPNGKFLLVSVDNNKAILYDMETGKERHNWSSFYYPVHFANFSKDSKYVTFPNGRSLVVLDTHSGKKHSILSGHTQVTARSIFTPDNKQLIMFSHDRTIKVWDVINSKLTKLLKGHHSYIQDGDITKDGKNLVSISQNGEAIIWNFDSGKIVFRLNVSKKFGNKVIFSPDGKQIASAAMDGYAKLWDVATGKIIFSFKHISDTIWNLEFSPDGAKLLVASDEHLAKVWNTKTGLSLFDLTGHTGNIQNAKFSKDGKSIATVSLDSTVKIWNATNGNLLNNLTGHTGSTTDLAFSNNGTLLSSISTDSTAKVWDFKKGKLLFDLKAHKDIVVGSVFSPDNLSLITYSFDGSSKIWNLLTGKLKVNLIGHKRKLNSLTLSRNGDKLITNSLDNTSKIWDAKTGKLFYTFFSVDTSEYLIVDQNNHYDGTEAARKLLYFTCGTEVIELDQVKDQLWVPNLAERIMKGEIINAPSLADLNICNLIPLVEIIDEQNIQQYRYKITPQKGGLGETVLYVNGIEAKRYKPEHLIKKGNEYELVTDNKEIASFFKSDEENKVTVKSFTAKNDIGSRGVSIIKQAEKTNAIKPHLYAVMVGVSDYKGDELDLKYAGKDATDLGKALEVSAAKLLGKPQVHVYNLTTEKEHYNLPEKKAIQQTLEEIGKKATTNDILLVFFAGHGVMEGEKKQFYFLTADASKASAVESVDKVGISTAELSDWMKPQSIKAQKRILILDACNSGQAIKDLVKIGDADKGYLAARSDDNAQQIKAIDKLNEKSGLFILSASASNQSAYEFGRYNQGLLTYALLKTIKQQPDILEDGKLLNVSRWFNAAEKEVSNIIKQNGARQEPQIVSTTNFNIGIVDGEVMAAIQLPNEKALFARSNFLNATSKTDNLKLRNLIDKELSSISTRGNAATISYSADYEGNDAYSLAGDYAVNNNNVEVTVLLTQGDGVVKSKFTISGSVDNLKKLAADIAEKAAVLVNK